MKLMALGGRRGQFDRGIVQGVGDVRSLTAPKGIAGVRDSAQMRLVSVLRIRA